MTANKPSTATGWTDPDDAPDLSTPEYQAKLAATPVQRGRPKSESPKVRIGLRLSTALVERLRARKGYNRLVEDTLRKELAMAEAETSDIRQKIKKRRRLATKTKKSAPTSKRRA
jgi:uncharacterized protein (DUF4415 family)